MFVKKRRQRKEKHKKERKKKKWEEIPLTKISLDSHT